MSVHKLHIHALARARVSPYHKSKHHLEPVLVWMEQDQVFPEEISNVKSDYKVILGKFTLLLLLGKFKSA
jgi:hypothetical protein